MNLLLAILQLSLDFKLSIVTPSLYLSGSWKDRTSYRELINNIGEIKFS